jgi:hypothetical protein
MASHLLPDLSAPAPEPSVNESLPPSTQPATPLAATVQPPRRPKRAYRRHKPYRPTRRQREAFSRNLAKARQALRQRGWPHSEKQRAAARENIRKAQAAIRKHGLPATEARRRANLANLAKANAVLRAQGYPRNEKQKQAARANLAKAHEASRDLANYARYHKHKLVHGLQAKKYDELLMLYVDMREAARARRRERLAKQG